MMYTSINLRQRVLRLLLALACGFNVLAASEQSAVAVSATGWVKGNFKFWNKNGNYCPTGAACNGARYTQIPSFDKALPVSNAAAYVEDAAGNVIGQGLTDVNGDYTIQWTTNPIDGFPPQLRVGVGPTHSRFALYTGTGSVPAYYTVFYTTSPSSSQASPQVITPQVVGSTTLPSKWFNAYWAAELQYRNVLSLVGVILTGFTQVSVRGFSNNQPAFLGNCPSSCTDAPGKRVQLDTQAGFSPQGRIMHELGHVASYVARPWKVGNGVNYTYNGNGGWVPAAAIAEFGSAAFEEAMATHYGNMTFWADNSPSTTCVSSLTCYSGVNPAPLTDVEVTSYPQFVNNCVGGTEPESRWAITAMRFLWDVFDNRNDAIGDGYSANQGNFWQHASLMQFYPAGTGFDQHEETWNSAKSSVTEPDGRGLISYRDNYVNSAGLPSLMDMWVSNCSPP